MFSLLSLIIVISKVASSADHHFGDFAIFVMVHELMNQGHVLYSEIFDHKDIGFYFFNQIFYDISKVTGLYIFALLAVVAYFLGLFLILRQLFSKLVSFLYSTIGVLIYVNFPSFKSTYSEDLAVSFSLISLGLFFNFPFIGGLFLVVACSIKITSVIIFIFLIMSSFFVSYVIGDKNYLKKMLLFSFGLLSGLIILVIWFASYDVLTPWFKIIDYNSIYSQIVRGGYFPTLLEPKLLVMDIVRVFFGADGFYFTLLLLLLLLSTTCLVWYRYHFPNLLWKKFLKVGVISTGGFISGFSMLYLQVPPAYHHYQHLAGLLIPLLILFSGMLLTMVINNQNKIFNLKMIIFIFPVIFLSLNFSLYKDGLIKWLHFDDPGYMMSAISKIPPNTKIAMMGGNLIRVDFSQINQNTKLSCRFFYQFSHILDVYKDEIYRCFNTLPEIVFYGDIKYRDGHLLNIWGDHYEEFSNKVMTSLKKEHHICEATSKNMYQVYVKNENLCNIFQEIKLKEKFPDYYNKYVKDLLPK